MALKDLLEQIKDVDGVTKVNTAASSLIESYAAVTEENTELWKSSKAFRETLEQAQVQAAKNIKTTKKLIQQGRLSARDGNAAIRRQVSAIDQLVDNISEESKARVLGTKEVEKHRKSVAALSAAFTQEAELSIRRERGRAAAFKGMMVATKAWAKDRERRAEAREIGQGIQGKLSQDYGGKSLVDKSQEALNKRGKGGVFAAFGLGAAVAGIASLSKIQRRAFETMSDRVANFGAPDTSALSVDGPEMGKDGKPIQVATAAGLRMKAYEEAIAGARTSALGFGLDPDAAQASFKRIADMRGVTGPEQAAEATKGIVGLAAARVGTVESITENVAFLVDQVGMGEKQAVATVRQTAAIARTSKVRMSDFSAAIDAVADSTGSLSRDQIGLSRSFGLALKASEKLNVSYNRQIAAARGLVEALTSSYDEGFAIVEARRDLEIASNLKGSKENLAIARDAKRTMAMLDAQQITEQAAAQFLRDSGATQTMEIQRARLDSYVEDFRSTGSLDMVKARMGGKEVSQDLAFLIADRAEGRLGDDDVDKRLAALNAGAVKDDKKIGEMAEMTAKQGTTAADRVAIVIEEMQTKLAANSVGFLDFIKDRLGDFSSGAATIGTAFGGIFDSLIAVFKNIGEKIDELAESPLGRMLGLTTSREQTEASLASMVENSGLARKDSTMMGLGGPEDDRSLITRLASNPDKMAEFRERAKGGFSEEQRKVLGEIWSGAVGKTRAAALVESLPQSSKGGGASKASGTVIDTKIRPDGSAVRTITLTDPVYLGTQQKADNIKKGGARAAGRQGPG